MQVTVKTFPTLRASGPAAIRFARRARIVPPSAHADQAEAPDWPGAAYAIKPSPPGLESCLALGLVQGLAETLPFSLNLDIDAEH